MSINKSLHERHIHNGDGTTPVGVSPADAIAASPSATQVPPTFPRPSPSIHEDIISRHLLTDPLTRQPIPDVVISRMCEAVEISRNTAERVSRLAMAIHNNMMPTVAARHRQVHEEAWKAIQPALRALDAARDTAKQVLKTLEENTASPAKPKDMLGALKANEIRAVLRGLSETDREAMLATALADDDDALISAVVDQPAPISGITKARQQMLHGAWRTKRHGPDLDRMARIQKAIVDLDRAGELTIKYASSLSDSKLVERAEASEAAVAAALKA